jgi:hypothetical protein
MNKTLLSVIVAAFVATSAWSATEVKSDQQTFSTGGLKSFTVGFDLSGKDLINTEHVLTGLDEAYGVSLKNSSYCGGSTPYGPAFCGTNVSNFTTTTQNDSLFVNFAINLSENMYARAYIYEFSVQISYDLDEHTIFDGATKTIHLEMPATQWADIHYKINNGGQLNYRMLKNGDAFSHQVQVAIANGDVVEYRTTSLGTNGVVVESPWDSFVVSGIVPFLQNTAVTNNAITVTSQSNLDWIIAHYSVNGSSVYNRTMQSNATEHSVLIPEFTLVAGDSVSVYFTYHVNGSATTTTATVLVVE